VTTSYEYKFPPGTPLTGKWNHQPYRVERQLGEGANGRVYLVSQGKQLYALKTGFNPVDLQSEINVLQTLAQTQKKQERYLIDVDDVVLPGGTVSYYVMRYCKGLRMHEYIDTKGSEWFGLIGYNLLCKLGQLHEVGYVFGDLKLENIIVSDYGEVQLVDYGGVTAIGKSVKQYTEIFDRGYWGAGDRMADEGYDLFSFAVLCLHLMHPKEMQAISGKLLPQNRNTEALLILIKGSAALKYVAPSIAHMLSGEHIHTREACIAWRRTLHQLPKRQPQHDSLRWLKGMFVFSITALITTILFIMNQ
jgi:serine/threonine-protein kinase